MNEEQIDLGNELVRLHDAGELPFRIDGGSSDEQKPEPSDSQPSRLDRLKASVLLEGELATLEMPPVKKYLGPIAEGALGQIYGPRGIGKTWFRDALALCLTRGQNFGPMTCENPAGVLILDGEMPLHLLKDRYALARHAGEAVKPMDLVSNETLYRMGGGTLNLLDAEWRAAVVELVKSGGERWDIIFIDNLSSFLPGARENDSEAWGPINQFLLELRWLGKAVVFIHHSGKSGDQRGTSGREDQLDFVWKLSPVAGHSPDEGCKLEATLTKSRTLTGPEAAPFQFSIIDDPRGGLTWTTADARTSKKNLIIALLGSGMKQADVAEAAGANRSHVSRVRAEAIKSGLLTSGGEFTPEGKLRFGFLEVAK